jgi:hypothetical protein
MAARRPRGTTAQNVELYSSAFHIAWRQISPLRKREQPDISLRLHASIRRQLNQGATDPLSIATEAFKALFWARSLNRFFQRAFPLLRLRDYNGQMEIHPSLLNVVLHEEPHINS